MTAEPHEVKREEPGRTPSRDELAAAVVLGVHRLVKQSTLYAPDNEAQVQALELTRRAVAQYGRRLGTNPQIFFSEKSVFVGGRLLRAGRSVYSAALELAKVFRQFDLDEIAIGYDVPVDDLQRFQAAIRAALRREGPSPAQQRYSRIRLRRGHGPGRRPGERDEDLPPEALVVRVYATATVVMRRFLETLQQEQLRPPVALRRVAQQLAELGAVEAPGLLGKMAVHNVEQDHAARAVNAALVALGMARQLVRDKRILARIATAALFQDIGVPRVAGTGPLGETRVGMLLPNLVEDQLNELPPAAAAVSAALGGFRAASQMHTVMVHEALCLAHPDHIAPAYRGLRHPTLAARIVGTARRFTELLADPEAERTADDAICSMLRESRDDADRTSLRLLLGALGIFPTGSLVELSNGLIGEVISVSDNPLKFGLPVLRPVVDARGAKVQASIVDLAQAKARGENLTIRRVVELGSGNAPQQHRQDPQRQDLHGPDLHRQDLHGQAPHEQEKQEDRPTRPEPHPSWSPSPESRDEFVVGAQEEVEDDGDDAALNAFFDSIVTADEPSEPEVDIDLDDSEAPPDDYQLPSDDGRTALFGTHRSTQSAEKPPSDDDDRRRTVPRMPRAEAPAEDDAPELFLHEPSDEPRKPEKTVFRGRQATRTQPSATEQARDERAASQPVAEVAGPAERGPQPTARGVLAKTPLVHLLVYALDQNLTGTTELVTPEGGRHYIYFSDGVPGKARTAGSEWPLDRVLTELGMVDEDTLQSTMLQISRTGELHGRHLIDRGLLDLVSLGRALAAQLARKIAVMFELPDATRYSYYAGVNLLESYGGPELTPTEPLALIARGVRRLPSELVRATVGRLGEAPLRLARDAELGRLQLTQEERTIIDHVRARPMTLSELLQRDLGGTALINHEFLVLRTLYLLIVTRCLKLGPADRRPLGADKPRHELPPIAGQTPVPMPSAPARVTGTPEPRRVSRVMTPLPDSPPVSVPVAPVSVPLAPPVSPRIPPVAPISSPGAPISIPVAPSSSPRRSAPRVTPRTSIRSPVPRRSTPPVQEPPRERRGPSEEEIERRFEAIDEITYYEILGVDSKASPETIEQTYFQLAKVWHPDRLPPDAANMRTKVDKIFSRMNDAYQTLTDADRRHDYDSVVQQGGGTARDRELVERAVDSAIVFQKAEVLFRRGQYEGAEKLLLQAVKTDPQQPEYRTLLAWVQAKRMGPAPPLAEGERSSQYKEQLKILNEVIDKEPDFERALFYRAELLKRSGDMDRAIRDYRKVTRLNKRNIDAAREVRLYDLRQRQAGGGLFGRLFGNKESKPPTSNKPRRKT
jgi:curved DNA-binding protein CbpA